MMDEGTGNLSAIDVNAAFARIGAHLDTDVSADATVFTVTALAKFARQALSLLADCVDSAAARRRGFRSHPAASIDEAGADSRYAVGDRRSRDHAGGLRHASLRAHGARHRGIAAPAEHRDRQAVSRATSTARRMRRSSRLATSTPSEFRQMASDMLRRVGRRPSSDSRGCARSRRRLRLPCTGWCSSTRPGAAQSEIRIGEVGLARSTPDYHPLIVLNMILGGQFVSRINMKLRQEKGSDLRRPDRVRLPPRARAVHSADQRAERWNRGSDYNVVTGDPRDPD